MCVNVVCVNVLCCVVCVRAHVHACVCVMYMRVGVLLVGGYDLTYSRQMAGRQPTTTGHGNAQQRPEPRLPGVSVPLLGWP